MTSVPTPTTPTTRLPARSARGLILGLSASRCAVLGAALLIVLAALLSAGIPGVLAAAVAWVPLAATAYIRLRGRVLVEWLPPALHYSARLATGQTAYRAAITGPRPAGTLALPGDTARLRIYNDPISGACLVHDPHRQTLTAVVTVTHPAYLLLAPATQHARTRGWADVIAALAATGSATTIQILETTVPDPGTGVTGWWDSHGHHDNSWAATEYQTLLDTAKEGSSIHHTRIAISVDMRASRRTITAQGRGLKGAAAVMRADMAALEHTLRAAELRVDNWLDQAQLAALVRHAYDPDQQTRSDAPAPTPAGAGPVAVDEHWDHIRHDSGYSTTLWISEWPRTEQRCDFLHPVVFAHDRTGNAVRKHLSLIITPLPAHIAQAHIQREITEHVTDAEQKARIGQVARAADRLAHQDVLQRDQSLAAGHADCEYSGFITVTAATHDELTDAVAVITTAAHKAHCELRILYGAQSQAFTLGALPFARRPT